MQKLIAFIYLLIGTILAGIIPVVAADNNIPWTMDELAFLKEHPVIRLGVDPGFVPFEFIDDKGEYRGIAADYLSLIHDRTGLQFEVAKNLTWPEAYDLALAGGVDALPSIGKTPERENQFLFSEPYYYFKRVIVTQDTNTEISGLEDLEGLTVAVQRNSSHHSYLLDYPKINLSLYDSVEAALTAVAAGTETAFIGNIATTNYLIRTTGLTNLRLISFEAEKQQALYFAVRKDWPEMIRIFNKAMDTIPESEKTAINNKWIELDTKVDYRPIIRMVSIVGSLLLVIFAVSTFWIVRLRKEIRQRKAIQQDLEIAKREADEANQIKSSFMARMSHEIRTPLNAITGMSYLLKKSEISLTQSMYIDRISQAANNMLSIINDILDFSKIEAGKVELEITSFNIDQVIQDVVNIVSYKIQEQEISFRLIKDPLIPNWLIGDAKRIEQVLVNILNNAAKFTHTGEVSLDIRLVAKENEKYHISFTVKDTGIGMTEEQVKKLFMPFEQGDISINRRFGGSGLGLSIVKNLIEMMEGEIKVFSTPGEGSTFIIDLSLMVDKDKEAIHEKSLSGKHFQDLRALVLEKTGANINLIQSYLNSFGIHCELTSSEASASAMLEAADSKFSKPFDLFILDYDTPAEGGFRYADIVRNNPKIGKPPKIIMLLPMMRADLFDRLNEHGIDAGIGKPIIPSILLNGILDIFNLKAISGSQPSATKELLPVKFEEPHYVLLAEDNKTNQMIAKTLLEQIGIESIIANDGKEAVEQYQKHQAVIELILMDLHMPVMNGYEAAEEIRKISATIPIIAMTADVILDVRDKCEKSGIYDYISKPFHPDRFIQKVKDIILENNHQDDQIMPVLDRTLGLRNMGGNDTLYQQVLEAYRIENRDTAERLSTAINEKQYAEAIQIVHKVKSSSGSIGAMSLYNATITLQKALKEDQNDEITAWYEKFSELMGKLLVEISE